MFIRNITKITNDSFKKLNEDVSKILLEDIEAVKRQYSHIPEEEFDEIIKLDPTYKDGSNSVGKYGKWLLGLYKKDNPLEYDVEEIYGLLSLYDNYKNDRKKEIEKDINKFKSIEELNDAVNNAEDAELSARQKERELRNAYKDAKLVFSDSKWEIWIPETYAASCTLGKGTEWCTADSRTDEYYKEYTRQGPLYVFINKQNPKEKYQLHMETKSFMDEDDRPENLEDVLSTDDKLREFVYSDIYIYKVDKNGNFIYDGKNQVPESATSVIVEQGVTSIGEDAFSYCKYLQSITIPDSVTFIGRCAFIGCTSLQSITIPDSVTEIGYSAFDYCIALQLINIPDSVIKIGASVFYGCESLQSITIPDSVTSIGNYAFSYCTSLQSINIPDSVKRIGDYAFSYCESLQSVTIPDSVISIGLRAFSNCKSLQSITISDSVRVIDDSAFYGCKSLQSVTIPDSVTSIGNFAFDWCDNLKEVILENPNTEYEDWTFPEHTKIIKKGVNENMKNKKINQLMKAKKLLESKGYKVRKKSLKEAYEAPYFKAYITNLGKYNEGELVGEWVDFPIDEDDFEDVLKSIGIDDNYYEEWFVTDYDCNLSGFDWQELGEYPSLDDLNEFGELIDGISPYDVEVIENAYEIIGDLKETINAVEDGEVYYYPGVYNDEELGYWMIDEIYGGDPTPDLAVRYFDYERYGRDIRLEGRGDFTEDGFVDYRY